MIRWRVVRIFFLIFLVVMAGAAEAQTLTSANAQISWKVTNRFRFFKNSGDFRAHETAWRTYLLHIKQQNLDEAQSDKLIATTSVIGSEHVMNDRYIPFTRILRKNYAPDGWASGQVADTCWDERSRAHAACGSVDAYVAPKSHEIEMRVKSLVGKKILAEYNCEWRIGNGQPITAPCDEAAAGFLPYPEGATISVNVEGESAISTDAKVKDLLIVGMGDSFASGEGNPDVPVKFDENFRFNNLYPKRAKSDAAGNAQWLDELCHRSLYSHQMRTALQIAIENPQAAVTYLGYSCSGAKVDDGILGPQYYVDYISRKSSNGNGEGSARSFSGKAKDTQIQWMLRELCIDKPVEQDGNWTCPDGHYRRNVDFLLLSIGGNDIGFSNLVAWTTLRNNTSSRLAKFFGATVSAGKFADNMKAILPEAYARLAKAIEVAVPIKNNGLPFDASRVILNSYPDLLENEKGNVCPAGSEGETEDAFAANQSMDMFSSWLVVTPDKLTRAHDQLDLLHTRQKELAEDHGWSFAGRIYGDKPFSGHGFCAQAKDKIEDPAEILMMPCWGRADRDTQTCQQSWSGKVRDWRPYNPQAQHYPYALRQRWVRTFNDAYLAINQKVETRDGQIDERASATVFSETTGAMHPSAEGHAAMADAILLDLRPAVAAALAGE
jgi:hypothetical protein